VTRFSVFYGREYILDGSQHFVGVADQGYFINVVDEIPVGQETDGEEHRDNSKKQRTCIDILHHAGTVARYLFHAPATGIAG